MMVKCHRLVAFAMSSVRVLSYQNTLPSWQLREIITKVIDHFARCVVSAATPFLLSTYDVEAVNFSRLFCVRLIVPVDYKTR